MGEPAVTAEDEARAVRAIRWMCAQPLWQTWRPRERMKFTIASLLELPCCEQSIQVLDGYLPTDIGEAEKDIRRRALEILTAVALADRQPNAPPLGPPYTCGTS
jgi:hypothetical protein